MMNSTMMRRCILPVAALAAGIALASCEGDPADPGDTSKPGSTPVAEITHDALYVVNGGDNSITVINTETNEVASTIKLSNVTYPHHLSLSPDGSTLAVAVPGEDLTGGHTGHGGHGHDDVKGVVMLLDAGTGATITSRTFNAANHNAVFSPSGREIWTAQATTPGTVLVLDALTLIPAATVNVGSSPLEVSFAPDGKHAFVANNASNDVSVIDAATRVIRTTLSVDAGPVGAWPGRSNRMFVDNETGKSLTVIDAADLTITATYDLGFTPAMAAEAPGGSIWITDTDNGRVVVDPTLNGPVIATGAGAHAIAFSGDGRFAYVTNQNAGTVSVIDVATRMVTKTLQVGSKPNGMVWRAK